MHANFHSGEAKAYLTEVSSAVVRRRMGFNLGLTILDFDLVCIEWVDLGRVADSKVVDTVEDEDEEYGFMVGEALGGRVSSVEARVEWVGGGKDSSAEAQVEWIGDIGVSCCKGVCCVSCVEKDDEATEDEGIISGIFVCVGKVEGMIPRGRSMKVICSVGGGVALIWAKGNLVSLNITSLEMNNFASASKHL